MNDSKDGGPAFPCPMSEQTILNQDCSPFQGGMSLRDYFAAKAMQGECAAMWDEKSEWGGLSLDINDALLNRLAAHWYRIADAMLAARSA